MTTDDSQVSTALDQETRARIEALRQRRAASAPDANASLQRTSRRRRRHAAAGSRILVAGLSASAALGLMGAMAGPLWSGGSTAAPVTPVGDEPVVIVVRRSADGSDATIAQSVAPAPAVRTTNAPPVSSSQGS